MAQWVLEEVQAQEQPEKTNSKTWINLNKKFNPDVQQTLMVLRSVEYSKPLDFLDVLSSNYTYVGFRCDRGALHRSWSGLSAIFL